MVSMNHSGHQAGESRRKVEKKTKMRLEMVTTTTWKKQKRII